MKIRFLIIGLCLFIFHQQHGQDNLIKNGGFEELRKSFPVGWYALGSPDCYRDGNLIKPYKLKPNEILICQSPFEGKNYMGVAAYQFATEVLFCKLSESLKKGHVYSISMYVFCPKKRSAAPVPEISVYLSEEVMYLKGHLWCRDSVNHIVLKNDNYEMLKDDSKWIEVTGEFTAKGGEQFFSIGNFVGVNTDFIGKGNPDRTKPERDLPDVYYYFYDEVSLVEKEAVEDLQVNKPIVIDNIYFEFGKGNLLPKSFDSLDKLANDFKQQQNVRIEIFGYTDNVGNENDNQKLSELRAKSVFEYLVRKGLEKNKIKYFGFGASHPIGDNDTEEGRQRNRRVEFKLVPVDEK